MKKLIIVGFSAALLAGGFSSCAKTTKGKVSNEWSVTKWTSESTDTDSDGDKTIRSTSIEGTSGTQTNTFTSGGNSTTTTRTAAVNELSYTIEKDGTWSSVMDITWTSTFTGGSSSDATKTTSSGTWSFLSKNKSGEFKKNERLVFNTLSEASSTVSSTTFGGTTSSSNSSDSQTYAEGESAMIYLVVESKGKSLQLSSDMDQTSTSTSGGTTYTNSTTGSTSMTLEQK